MAIATVVYEDSLGITHVETVTTASMALIREEELEAAGYKVIHG